MIALLRNRALLIVGLAESVSGVGNWVTGLAVYALVIFRGGGGPGQASAILLAGLLPGLLFSPVAGWLCDRYDRRALMIASELLAGLAVVGLIFARRPVLIYGLLAVQAALGAVLMPARQAAVPQLVGRQELTRANALLQQLAGMVKIGGPFLAGYRLWSLTCSPSCCRRSSSAGCPHCRRRVRGRSASRGRWSLGGRAWSTRCAGCRPWPSSSWRSFWP